MHLRHANAFWCHSYFESCSCCLCFYLDFNGHYNFKSRGVLYELTMWDLIRWTARRNAFEFSPRSNKSFNFWVAINATIVFLWNAETFFIFLRSLTLYIKVTSSETAYEMSRIPVSGSGREHARRWRSPHRDACSTTVSRWLVRTLNTLQRPGTWRERLRWRWSRRRGMDDVLSTAQSVRPWHSPVMRRHTHTCIANVLSAHQNCCAWL